jgi:hydroxymethylglutaryl-CoA reductase (NADPH)
MPGGSLVTEEAMARRWEWIASKSSRDALLDSAGLELASHVARNIENYIGSVKVPVGLAGPLRVSGLHAHGDYLLPLATTEAALVASYARGASLITEAGGCTALLLSEGVTRSPGFVFRDLVEVSRFLAWAMPSFEAFKTVAGTTTSHGCLEQMKVTVEGNRVFFLLEFTTGDAAGQNMVTIATEAICAYILEHSPIAPQAWYVEANASSDKKASGQAFSTVRGKKVTAEVKIPADMVQRRLHASPANIVGYYRMSTMGGILTGTIGIQGHFANGLAALFIACGQDAACVAEAAVGTNRFELTPEGDLYVAVTLPNLIVGTVGGGTGLPSQKACLEIMGLAGSGKARAFAEVCAGAVLAGEISIAGAIAAGEFTRAHHKLARGREATDSHGEHL